jgi:hypothetical protein
LGVVLLGSVLTSPALAQSSNTLQDHVPGSLLVFPIFDIFRGPEDVSVNRTKIRVTCNGVTGTTLRFTYVCQPVGSSTTSAFCPSFDEHFPCTSHQTIVVDVADRIFTTCPSFQGYIVVWAESQCVPAVSGGTCPTATGGTLQEGEFGPISYNQLFGSYFLYYNGVANAAVTCGGVPCAPPAAGPFPDVEAANAIAIQSQQPVFSFLGTDTGGALQVTFGPTTAFDYVALPKTVETDFAAPGAALIAGPSTVPPFIPPDTVSGTELETNIILLNLNYTQFAANAPAAMSVNSWNWFEIWFTATHRFLCWERIPINTIDARITAAGPFGANYGNIRFTPSPLAGPTSPQLLGAIEEVADVGRTIRNLIHSSTAASPAVFVTDIEF